MEPPMPAKAIRIYTQTWSAQEYHEAVELGDAPADTDTVGTLYEIGQHADDLGEWNQDESAWIPASDVDTAAHLLASSTTGFWAATCSHTAAEIGPGAWYTDQLYTHPYTGEVTAKTARLEGPWTVEEARAIRAQVIAL
jgi:hypothetical protein